MAKRNAASVRKSPSLTAAYKPIAVALLFGMKREFAARFSFLMSIPAIGGATLLEFKDVELSALDPVPLGVGFVTSLVTGYAALVFLVAALGVVNTLTNRVGVNTAPSYSLDVSGTLNASASE